MGHCWVNIAQARCTLQLVAYNLCAGLAVAVAVETSLAEGLEGKEMGCSGLDSSSASDR